MLEVVVKGAVGLRAEDVLPFESGAEVVEDEAAEESVLGIGDKGEELPGRPGEDGGETRMA